VKGTGGVRQTYERESVFNGMMDSVPDIIGFIEDACEGAAVGPGVCFDLTLAVEEAASNVIVHGYRGSGGMLKIRFETTNGDVVIVLRDHARPFKPGKVRPPNKTVPLEDRPLGGLGMHLIHQLMDEVVYEVLPDGNLLTMIKRGAVTEPS